ncbi:MAG TPA: response regulator [Nitrososphaeraceae archaeon]|nr:response regulator [Nitrososphaeraceae archaeon]
MNKSILLVDDEPDITFTITNILEYDEFRVYTFNDPVIALKFYKTNFYDLIILDIKMPKMNGFKLYTKIRELDPNVRICFLTALAAFEEEYKKIQSILSKTFDKDFFIQKPIKIEDLINKITLIINKNEEY